MERTFLIIIIFIGIGMAVAMSAINGTWRATNFSDYHDDAEVYNITALSILEHHSFSDPQYPARGFVGIFRRSPGYPLFLAFSYALFGKTPVAAFATQTAIFLLSIFLLWRLACVYFPYPYRLAPPLLLALSWFIALQVTAIVPELLTLFLIILFLLAFECFFTTRRYVFLLLAGGALAWFILIRPVALYGVPFMLMLMGLRAYNRLETKHLARAYGALLVIPFLAIGAWMVRSILVLDTWQIQSGSYVLNWKTMEATASWERIAATGVATLTGDIVAEKIFPGYAAQPDHYAYAKIVTAHMLAMDAHGVSEAEKERVLYREARERIKKDPLKFIVSGIMGLFRQNVPLNHRAHPITHLFASGGYSFLSEWQKIAILLAIRFTGYVFLAFVIAGIIINRNAWRGQWGMVLFWMLFYNMFYAFFTHNEPRYILPLWPLYLLLATTAIRALINCYAHRIQTRLLPNGIR